MLKTVLIVDDSDVASAPLEVALTSVDGLELIILNSAREAMKILASERHQISALITDLHLPNMDGYELIAEVRRNQRYSALPIVVITGDSHPDTPDRLLRLGANAYFAKPYSPAEIRQKLEILLNAL